MFMVPSRRDPCPGARIIEGVVRQTARFSPSAAFGGAAYLAINISHQERTGREARRLGRF